MLHGTVMCMWSHLILTFVKFERVFNYSWHEQRLTSHSGGYMYIKTQFVFEIISCTHQHTAHFHLPSRPADILGSSGKCCQHTSADNRHCWPHNWRELKNIITLVVISVTLSKHVTLMWRTPADVVFIDVSLTTGVHVEARDCMSNVATDFRC